MGDPVFWTSVVQWTAGVSVGLIGLVWAANKARVDKIEKELALKADREEIERHRQDIKSLFESQAGIRKDMNGGFERITTLLHTVQIQILTELAKKADRP